MRSDYAAQQESELLDGVENVSVGSRFAATGSFFHIVLAPNWLVHT